jgi:Na+-transporting methylmalonyl-CoA/oxaloacetate decarboxylase gamma subunit
MPKGRFAEHIRNIFQRRGLPQEAEMPSPVQTAEQDRVSAHDPDTVAAIAAALYLSGGAERETGSGSEVAAVIAAALHLHFSDSAEPCVSDRKIYETTPWCEYGREQIQSVRFRVFNRPVSTDKILSIRER